MRVSRATGRNHHDHIELKPGTVALASPKSGASQAECFACTGPRAVAGNEREMLQEAFITGMAFGLKALFDPRPSFCVDHETRFRETLVLMGVTDRVTLDRLGIEYDVVGDRSPRSGP